MLQTISQESEIPLQNLFGKQIDASLLPSFDDSLHEQQNEIQATVIRIKKWKNLFPFDIP